MAVADFNLTASHVLAHKVTFRAIIPEKLKGPFPVLYLLHGLSDDHTTWTRYTSLERYVTDLKLIVVMPDGDRSFYVNHKTQPRLAYETFMTKDLIGYVDRMLPTIKRREGRAVAGLSMGGYGAVRLALGNPHLYMAAVSHSGALAMGHYPLTRSDDWTGEFAEVMGRWPQGTRYDLFTLAEQLPKSKRPALRIDCGKKDFLIAANRDFHKHLNSLKYAHEYAEHPGAHDWAYWDLHIRETIGFVTKHLKSARY